MPSDTPTDNELDNILFGIDLTEAEDPKGWWETSVESDFGRKKREELLAFIRHREQEAVREVLERIKTMKEFPREPLPNNVFYEAFIDGWEKAIEYVVGELSKEER